MALERTEYSVKIICDKCGTTQTEDNYTYNDAFFEAGWGLFPSARKYKHKCRNCQSKANKSGHDFVKEHFYKK